MSLSRLEYVEICETCVNRKSDFKKGIVCSLTGEYADFDTTCPYFEKNQPENSRIKSLNETGNYKSFNQHKPISALGILIRTVIGGLVMVGLSFLFLYLAVSISLYVLPLHLLFLLAGGKTIIDAFGNWELTKQTKERETSQTTNDLGIPDNH